jgi:hypothetical protein
MSPSNSSIILIDPTEERNVSAVLRLPQFQPVMPNILSFLSLVELSHVQIVNHRWFDLTALTKSKYIKKLHLGKSIDRTQSSREITATPLLTCWTYIVSPLM